MSARATEHTPATTRWRAVPASWPRAAGHTADATAARTRGRIPDRIPGRIPDRLPDRIPHRIPDRTVRRGTGWRVPVVALVGIDGVGKTTQARQLADWLAAAGVPADHWQNPGGRRSLDRLARRLRHPDAAALLGAPGLLTVEALGRWLAVARALTWSQLRGHVAVMDRYSYCQYANIRARGAPGEAFARLIFAAFPRPDLVCHLVVPPAEAHSRIEARGTDREDPAYLAATHRAYLALPEAAGFVPVDASGDAEGVAARLRHIVAARLLAGRRAPVRR